MFQLPNDSFNIFLLQDAVHRGAYIFTRRIKNKII